MRRAVILWILIMMVAATGITATGTSPPEEVLLPAWQGILHHGYAILTGKATYTRRDGGKTEEFDLRVAMISPFFFHPHGGQLILGPREEYRFFIGYDRDCRGYFGQTNAQEGSIPAAPDGGPLLDYLGLRIDDFALGFLYWNVIENADDGAVRNEPCHVVICEEYNRDWSENADSAPEPRAAAKIWLSEKSGLPVKVEFYRTLAALKNGDSPLRTMEITEYREQDGLHLPIELVISGDAGSVRIDLDQCEAGLVGYDYGNGDGSDTLELLEKNQAKEEEVAAKIFLVQPRPNITQEKKKSK